MSSPDPMIASVAESEPTIRVVEAARRAGLDAVHLHWRQLDELLLRRGVDAQAVDATFSIDAVRIGGLETSPLIVECRDDLEQLTSQICMQMGVARRLGLTCVSLSAGSAGATTFQYLLTSLPRLLERADELKVGICLRNAYGTELEQPDDVLRVFRALPTETLAVDLDIVGFHTACVNPCEAVWLFGSRIGKARIANVEQRRHAALERGELAVGPILAALRDMAPACQPVIMLGDDTEALSRLEEDVRYVRAHSRTGA